MDTCGYQMLAQGFRLMHQMVIGLIQRTDGHGYRISIGDGRHSITDGGSTEGTMDGSGYLIIHGGLHG